MIFLIVKIPSVSLSIVKVCAPSNPGYISLLPPYKVSLSNKSNDFKVICPSEVISPFSEVSLNLAVKVIFLSTLISLAVKSLPLSSIQFSNLNTKQFSSSAIL